VALKMSVLVAVPANVVTVMLPVVDPAGTVATIVVAVSENSCAAVPFKATPVATRGSAGDGYLCSHRAPSSRLWGDGSMA
jgi:hypothetical protein